jgi:membrane-bound ClpP family serine protease
MLTVVAIVLAVLVLPSPWGVLAVVAAAAIDVAETVLLIRRTRRRPSVVGGSALVGRAAVAATRLAPAGHVRVDGETWAAVVEDGVAVAPGDAVEVVALDGLVLVVRPARVA